MKRDEEIQKLIDEEYGIDNYGSSDYQVGVCDGVRFADKTMIEKACKWLENFLEKTIQKPTINDGYTSDTIDLVELKRRRLIEEVLYDFKKQWIYETNNVCLAKRRR